MATFQWKLFGKSIPETTEVSPEETELSPERLKEAQIDMQDSHIASEYRKTEAEDGYAISDAILEAYYLCCLRKIDKLTDPERPGEKQNGADNRERLREEPNRAEDRERLIEHLNRLDELLFLFVQRGKDLVQSLEADFAAIPPGNGIAIRDIAHRYAQEAYQWLRGRGGSIQDLVALEEELCSALPGSQEELRRYLYELREKLLLYRENGTGRSTIYKKLRELPRFLGDPFQKRYVLYKRLVACRTIAGQGKSPTVVYMLLEDGDFVDYSEQSTNNVAGYLAGVQSEICGEDDSLTDEEKMQERCQQLEKELAKIPVSNNAYIKRSRCFSIFEVKSGTEFYVSFSGLFDAVDPIIQNKFRTKHPALDSALDAVTAAVRGQFPKPVIRVKTTVDVKYYDGNSNCVTLGQVCAHVVSGFEHMKRMFSCCERKVLAELEKKVSNDIKDCTVYIKISPCELCEIAMEETKGYEFKVFAGRQKEDNSVADKGHYDKLAQDICSGKTGISFVYP